MYIFSYFSGVTNRYINRTKIKSIKNNSVFHFKRNFVNFIFYYTLHF